MVMHCTVDFYWGSPIPIPRRGPKVTYIGPRLTYNDQAYREGFYCSRWHANRQHKLGQLEQGWME